jgi:hypothetical protein
MVRHTVGELKAVGVQTSAIRREQFDFGTTSSPTEEPNPWDTGAQWKVHR